MGFSLSKAISAPFDGLGSAGGAKNAIDRGMDRYEQYAREGIGEIRGGYKGALRELNPFKRGSTAQGFDRNIASLLSGQGTQALIDERSDTMADYLASQGLGRSSYGMNEMGKIPIDVAMGIEQMLSGRQYQGGMARGGLMTERAVNIADLLSGIGSSQFQASQAKAQADATKQGQMLGFVGDVLGSAGSAGGMSTLFCDERLKKNKKPVGKIGDITLYSYDPNEEGKRLGMNSRFGPMAQDVKEKYPHLVSEHESGYLVVNMDGLLMEVA